MLYLPISTILLFSQVWCCDLSSDNEIVVSGSKDGAIRLWRLQTGAPICVYNTGADVFKIKISSDSRTVVALGDKMESRKLLMLQVVRRKTRSQVPSRATSPYASDASRPISPSYRDHSHDRSAPSPYRERYTSSSSYEQNNNRHTGYSRK